MGQKTNPIGNRLGIIRGWDSAWYGGKNFGDKLAEDSKIRKYIDARLAKASVSKVIIERTLKLVTITICTARPGIIIGKGGSEVDRLKEELKKLIDEITQEAKNVIEDYSDNPSKMSGSAVQINENSPFLDEIFEGNSWKKVIKGSVEDALKMVSQKNIDKKTKKKKKA